MPTSNADPAISSDAAAESERMHAQAARTVPIDPIRDGKQNQNQMLQQQRDQARLDAAKLRRELAEVTGSFSWRITSPLRTVGNALGGVVRRTGVRLRKAYWRFPISVPVKLRCQAIVFSVCAPLIRNTGAYRNWIKDRQESDGIPHAPTAIPETAKTSEALPRSYRASSVVAVEPCNDFVPHRPHLAPVKSTVRLITFYLPQFHPIPENDEWWGKGFTEWANVTRALPQFDGHYQPRLPSDLGFYDLRVPEIQRQQIALARHYGIAGFCYYFYWFDRKRLLELPPRRHLDSSDIDFPFCLCWANENWTRRWDGKDQQILIAQRHSEEDDIAFITYVSEYLRDPRYIRVNGKPLLLVYTPSILPDARQTADRWRQWCRSNGIGDIYLACIFAGVNPESIGFDAAVEFPPNTHNGLRDITHQIECSDTNFTGTVYDWRAFVERSRAYPAADYRLFRTVCPSWDNESRRPGRGTVFFHSTPATYREWLENACADTVTHIPSADERLVFVNAWNEWAEGAYLEPDRKYGYAWLDATHEALLRTAAHQP